MSSFGSTCWGWFLGIAIGSAIGSQVCNPTFAQVIADPSLGTIVTTYGNTLEITGGTTVGSTNLFHSFSNFSVRSQETVNFYNNSTINNILVRVTGGNPSDIQGQLRTQGQANLFLMNPNGIVFGENARLNIGGSFIGTTASAIQFPGGGEFSMTSPVNQLNPLLTVNPSAFLFNQIAAANILVRELSQRRISPVIQARRSLLLLGGNILVDGATLRAEGARVELGGVAGVGTIGLTNNGNNLSLAFPEQVERADVSLTNGARVNVSSGSVSILARSLSITNDSELSVVTNTSNQGSAANLSILVDDSVVLANNSFIFTGVESGAVRNGGNIVIRAGSLSLTNGAQVSTAVLGRTPILFGGQGNAGDINITVRDTASIDGVGSNGVPSNVFSSVDPGAVGRGGNINITAGSLSVTNGAQVSASTRGLGDAGSLNVTIGDSVVLSGTSPDGQFASGLTSAVEQGAVGNGGDITLSTNGRLLVRDGAEVTVSNQGTGNAGRIRTTVFDTRLDNQGRFTAQSESGKGGDIQLQAGNLLLLRGNSLISATSGVPGSNGLDGNINIDTKFLVAVPSENSDIVATGFGRTPGSNIQVNAQGIFGTQFRQQLTSESDIVATGQVTLTTPDVDPSQGLVELPTNLVDASQQIDTGCTPSSRQRASSFIVTGRGGLPPNPLDLLTPDAVQVDLITLNPDDDKGSTSPVTSQPTTAIPERILEATGWVTNEKGEVVLTANPPTITPHGSWQNPVSCIAS